MGAQVQLEGLGDELTLPGAEEVIQYVRMLADVDLVVSDLYSEPLD